MKARGLSSFSAVFLFCICLAARPACASPSWKQVSGPTASGGTQSITDGTHTLSLPTTLSVAGANVYGTNGACTPLAVKNTGTTAISGLFVSITSGADQSSFQACTYGTNPCATTLAAGASCNFGFQLLYTGGLGTRTATISVGASGLPYASVVMTGISTVCLGSPGLVCGDGSLFVGSTPDGNVPVYAMRCDVGLTWQGTSCSGGTASTMGWGLNGLSTSLTSKITGQANTAGLVVYATYNDGLIVGAPAASACKNATTHGHNDWYLPAMDELYMTVQLAGSTANWATLFNFVGNTYYWSSTENSPSAAYYVGNGYSTVSKDSQTLRVRCFRKGP